MYESKRERRLLKRQIRRGVYVHPRDDGDEWKVWRAVAIAASNKARDARCCVLTNRLLTNRAQVEHMRRMARRRDIPWLAAADYVQQYESTRHFGAIRTARIARRESGVDIVPRAMRAMI